MNHAGIMEGGEGGREEGGEWTMIHHGAFPW